MPKVSVIIPVYNAEKFIGRCLDALINQTHSNIEVICVNDGSKDNSLQILKEYSKKDNRIVVFSQKNSGPAKARNLALNNARGEYIMFCDSDDEYRNDMVEKMLNSMVNEKVDLVMCDCKVNDISGSQEQCFMDYHRLALVGYQNIDFSYIFTINALLWNKIFDKKIIDKYNITYPIQYEHDDSIFVANYILYCKNYYGLNEQLYTYTTGSATSIMGQVHNKTNQGRELDYLFSHYEFFKYLKKYSNSKNIEIFANYMYERCFSVFYKMNSKELQKKAYKELKRILKTDSILRENKYFADLYKAKTFKEFNAYIYNKCQNQSNINFIQKLFSVKNNYSNGKKKKVIRLLGFKLTVCI